MTFARKVWLGTGLGGGGGWRGGWGWGLGCEEGGVFPSLDVGQCFVLLALDVG